MFLAYVGYDQSEASIGGEKTFSLIGRNHPTWTNGSRGRLVDIINPIESDEKDQCLKRENVFSGDPVISVKN